MCTERQTAECVLIGQVWADNDPRGGPTFKIVAFDGDHAVVTDLNGNRRRKIQRKRIRPGKRGYRLVQNIESAKDQRVFAAAEFLSAFHGEVNDSQVMPPEDYVVDAIRLLAHIDGSITERTDG